MICKEYLEWQERETERKRRKYAEQEVLGYIVETVLKRGKKGR